MSNFGFLCIKMLAMNTHQNQFYNALLGYAAQRALSPQRLCEASSVNFAELQKKNCSLTAEQINSLWRNAAHLTQDPYFGLHFGESMQLAALGLIGQVIATSNTVGEALTHAGNMVHLITDMFQIQIEKQEANTHIHFIANKEAKGIFPFTYRHMSDYLMVFVLHEMNGLILQELQPEKVNINHDLKDIREYGRIFRCPILDNSKSMSIELPNQYLSIPIITSNYSLQKTLLQQIDNLLKSSPVKGAFQQKIYHYLMANSFLRIQSLGAVAANFNMSSRSLQRKLKNEGITYLEIVEEVRKNLALHYLKSENHQIKDIAYTLGYTESSAFLKAFKRWTGKTPSMYLTSTG